MDKPGVKDLPPETMRREAELSGETSGPRLGIRHAPARESHEARVARIDRVTPDIIAAIEACNFPRTAAAAAGVPYSTWMDWKRMAAEGDRPCIELFEKVSCALAKAEMELVRKLKTPPLDGMGKADTGWIKATTTILERVHREQWGERIEVRVKVDDAVRELIDDLEARMPPESFQDFVVAMAEIEADRGAESS
jgi:hypothetical protein